MTIMRGLSLEGDIQELDLNIDQTALSGSALLRLSRQNSLLPDFSSLPDFSNLLTPTMKAQPFDFEKSMYEDNGAAKTLEDVKNILTPYHNEALPLTIKTEDIAPSTATETELTSFIAAVTQANSFHDNQTTTVPSIVNIKQESLDATPENQLVTIRNDGSIEMTTYSSAQDVSLSTFTPAQDVTSSSDNPLTQVQARIERATRQLNISKDPWLWSEEQVNNWVQWLFITIYETEPMFTLNLDGTKLCMANDLSQLVNGQEGAAEIIITEIDLWKEALRFENDILARQQQQHQQQQQRYFQQQQQQQQQQAYVSREEQPVYFDLTNSRPVMSHHVQKPTNFPVVSSIQQIPVPTPTVQPQQSLNSMSMTLNELNQQMQFEYNNRTTYPPIYIQPQVSPSSSVASSQGWDSPRSMESGFASASGEYTSMDEDTRSDASPAPVTAATTSVRLPHSRNSIKLWQFLRHLLEQSNMPCIRWVDREKGIFKIEDSQKVAKMWGQRKNRPAMNYDKLSRSIRQYYKKGIIKKTDNSKRLVYQFCEPYL